MTDTATRTELPGEVVTHTPVQDVVLPGGGGVLALVTLDNGHDHTRPNTFGPASIAELRATVDRLTERANAGEIQAVGITGKPFVFAVGADLSGVPSVTHEDQALEIARAGHAAFAAIMDLPVPTFAFVNGAAMGGGVEIALACDHRTISAGVPALALPECFLGLVPGWGGCYLLPRLVGPEKALSVIVDNPLNQNTMLKGPQAFALGIADAMFEPADFLEDSLRWAGAVVRGEVTVERVDHTADESVWEAAVSAATRTAKIRTAGRAPAPFRAIELVRAARTSDRGTAFAAEDRALADLIMGDELRAGLYAFDLVQKRAKRPAGAPDKALARKVTKVGIVGAGLMASQLALLFARNLGVPVVLTDLDQERVDRGVGWVHGEVGKLLAKGRIGQDKANFLTGLVTGSTGKEGFADADFVIEAVFEEMSVKKQVWAEVEAVVSPECVLASNTSSLSITEMAADLDAPRAGRRLPLLQPRRRHAAPRGDPGRADRRRLSRNGIRHRALAQEDDDPRQGLRVVHRQPAARPLHGRVQPGRRGGHARRGRRPRGRRPCAHAAERPAPARRAGDRAAQQRDAAPRLRRPLLRLGEPQADRRGAQAGLLHDGRDRPPGAGPRRRGAARPAGAPVVLDVAQVRDRVLSAIADEVRRMLDEGVAQSPMDIDLGMITGAGFQFWNGGITPLLDREGVSERVAGARFLPEGVASVPGRE